MLWETSDRRTFIDTIFIVGKNKITVEQKHSEHLVLKNIKETRFFKDVKMPTEIDANQNVWIPREVFGNLLRKLN